MLTDDELLVVLRDAAWDIGPYAWGRYRDGKLEL